jgi:uncharacterized membrane protein
MKTSSKELKRIARENLTGHYKIPMGAFLVAGLIPFVIELPFSMLLQNEYATVFQTVLYAIVELLISLLGIVLSAGVLDIHLNMARQQEYRLSQTFGLVRDRPDRYLVAGILLMVFAILVMLPGIAGTVYAGFHPSTGSIVLAGVLMLAGIVAGIYLALRLSQVFYILLDDGELSPWQAIVHSAKLMKHNVGRLFVLYLSFLGYMLLGVITLGIGMLWVMPYQTQTMTQFYLDLLRERSQKTDGMNFS